MNQPETFAQLLAKATPGPFGVSESGKSIWHGDPEEYLSVCHTSFETTEHTPADMELIARLLNFAHAGGVIALRDALDRLNCANERAARSGVIGFRTDDLEHALVILNDQTK